MQSNDTSVQCTLYIILENRNSFIHILLYYVYNNGIKVVFLNHNYF